MTICLMSNRHLPALQFLTGGLICSPRRIWPTLFSASEGLLHKGYKNVEILTQ